MSKIAFLYPGQGAQYVGMGKDLYENNAKAKQYFDSIKIVLLSYGLEEVHLCFIQNLSRFFRAESVFQMTKYLLGKLWLSEILAFTLPHGREAAHHNL